MKIIFMPPVKACLSVIEGLFAEREGSEWIGPAVFDVWGIPKQKPLRTASANEIEKIVNIADEIYQKVK